MEIGDMLRAKRRAQHVTQQRLGEMLGYKGRSAELMVQHWENNRRQIPLDKIKLVAKVLDIPVEDLLP